MTLNRITDIAFAAAVMGAVAGRRAAQVSGQPAPARGSHGRERRRLVSLAAVVVLAGSLLTASVAGAATLSQAIGQLRSWQLQPTPLVPSQLPPVLAGATVALQRFNGIDYSLELAVPSNGCQRVVESDVCVELRRSSASALAEIMSDPDNESSPQQLRVGGRTVWFLEEGRDAGGWEMAWQQDGHTYWAWEWTDNKRTARQTLTPLIESLRALSSPRGLAPPLRHCQPPSPNANAGPRDDRSVPFGSVTTRNMTCAAALTAIRLGHINPRFHTPGFGCTVVKRYASSGTTLGEILHCASGSRRFQWQWAT